MKSLKYIVTIVVLFLLTSVSFAQDYGKVQIKTIHVSGNIYMLQGAGGNIGVSVGADGLLIVDDQFAPLADKIRAALGKLGEGKLRFLLNTHWHGDHTGGNAKFGKEATIIAHTNVRKRLQTRQVIEMFNMVSEPAPNEALPVITFDHSLSVHFNDEEIRVLHLPEGHTDSDSVIFFMGSNVVHIGDLLFSGMFPFVDLGSGGDVKGYIKNVESILDRLPRDVKIIPGHGPLSDIKDLKAFHEMLVGTTKIINQRMAAGKNLRQIQAQGLPKKWAMWGNGLLKTSQWIEIVYKSFSEGG